MENKQKLIQNRIGYLLLLGCLIALLFFNEPVFAKQPPFNYTINVRNESSLNLNSNAECNLTIITNSPAPLIGNAPVPMINISNGNTINGTYAFTINESWIVGDYSTQITCIESGIISSRFDSFAVGLETTDFRDLSIVGSILLVAGLFLFISFKSDDRLLNPIFFFIGVLMIITDFFISSLLTTNSEISTLMLRVYATLIVVYMLGVMAYVFIGWFIPFMFQAFVKKKSDDQVLGEVD